MFYILSIFSVFYSIFKLNYLSSVTDYYLFVRFYFNIMLFNLIKDISKKDNIKIFLKNYFKEIFLTFIFLSFSIMFILIYLDVMMLYNSICRRGQNPENYYIRFKF